MEFAQIAAMQPQRAARYDCRLHQVFGSAGQQRLRAVSVGYSLVPGTLRERPQVRFLALASAEETDDSPDRVSGGTKVRPTTHSQGPRECRPLSSRASRRFFASVSGHPSARACADPQKSYAGREIDQAKLAVENRRCRRQFCEGLAHARELARVFGAALRVDLAPHSTLSESRDAQHVLGDHAGIVVRLGIFPAS